MTPLERSIVEAVARTRRDGLEPTSIYLRPEQVEELGGVTEIGGLPVKRVSGRGRARVYTRRGLARAISPASKLPPASYTPAEQLLLVSLLHGWPPGNKLRIQRRLQDRGLVSTRTTIRRHGGRSHKIEEPRLTGAGEAEAQRLWDALARGDRAELRAAAWKAGL